MPYTYEQRAGVVIRRIAAIALGGHRVVAFNSSGELIYADKDTASQVKDVAGITIGAVSLGGSATVLKHGPLVELSWSWTPKQPIYCGSNGVLTQTVPTSGWARQVAFAETATKIFVELQEPVQL